jgi:ABC transporter substrate binding protein
VRAHDGRLTAAFSYGPDTVDQYRRAAHFVDKILKGTKPADIPVEQPMEFEFVINLKTAKQIGVTIPQSVLYRADKVLRRMDEWTNTKSTMESLSGKINGQGQYRCL